MAENRIEHKPSGMVAMSMADLARRRRNRWMRDLKASPQAIFGFIRDRAGSVCGSLCSLYNKI